MDDITSSVPAATDSGEIPDLSGLMSLAMELGPTLLQSLGGAEGLSGLLSSLGGGDTPAPAAEGSPPAEAGADFTPALAPLPDLGRILPNLSGPKKSNAGVQLLKALKPFMHDRRASKIDRAVSMLETAYAAKSALSVFSSLSGQK